MIASGVTCIGLLDEPRNRSSRSRNIGIRAALAGPHRCDSPSHEVAEHGIWNHQE